MFWFMRKRFVGSYFFLERVGATSRVGKFRLLPPSTESAIIVGSSPAPGHSDPNYRGQVSTPAPNAGRDENAHPNYGRYPRTASPRPSEGSL